CLVQNRLGAANAGAVDISAACSSFVYALSVAHAHVVAGLARRVLVIGAEALSRVTDFTDRSTCILFGDGAGAVVLAPSETDRGLLSFWLGADGSKGSHIAIPAGGSRMPASAQTVADRQHYIKMAGQEVYKFATRIIPRAIEEAARRAGMPLSDIDLFIPHQANIRIIEAAAERLGQPMDKFFVNVDRYGNTSAASVPVALYEAVESNRVRDGHHVILLAFGGGLTWASCALRWG
ncbi:MAG: beta-ketoacyl-ACP synthase 3, partial [Armatimonadetes bacterium]|nr:beta-ketoacyl-ACP synthase 3 [Armatimonadota bacterium]